MQYKKFNDTRRRKIIKRIEISKLDHHAMKELPPAGETRTMLNRKRIIKRKVNEENKEEHHAMQHLSSEVETKRKWSMPNVTENERTRVTFEGMIERHTMPIAWPMPNITENMVRTVFSDVLEHHVMQVLPWVMVHANHHRKYDRSLSDTRYGE